VPNVSVEENAVKFWQKITPWSSVLLEKIIVVQLVKILIFYGTWWFITVFKRDHYWIKSWATWIQSTFSYPFSVSSILIELLIYASVSHVVSSLHIFYPKFCTHFSFIPCYTLHPSHPPLFDHPNTIFIQVSSTHFFFNFSIKIPDALHIWGLIWVPQRAVCGNIHTTCSSRLGNIVGKSCVDHWANKEARPSYFPFFFLTGRKEQSCTFNCQSLQGSLCYM
jgi:hypothetical protein